MSAAVDGIRVAEAICSSLEIDAAAAALQSGGMAIFPTDTVAGIGISVGHPESLGKLYEAKGRDEDKPIAWLVDSPDSVTEYGEAVPGYAVKLAERFWPGALTIVVSASQAVDASFASRNGTIGLRMPESKVALGLVGKTGCPLATTSANISGLPAPCSMDRVDKDFAKEAMRIECAGRRAGVPGTPSTVIDCTGSAPILVREGTIPFPEILEAFESLSDD